MLDTQGRGRPKTASTAVYFAYDEQVASRAWSVSLDITADGMDSARKNGASCRTSNDC